MTAASEPEIQASAGAIEAEQSVLGALLLDPETAGGQVDAEGLTAADFHERDHGPIYAAITRLRERGDPVDPVTVYTELSGRGEPAALPFLVALSECVPSARHAGHYAGVVRRAAWRRRIETQARALQRAVASPGIDDAQLAQLVGDLSAHLEAGARTAAPSFRALPLADLSRLRIEAPSYLWQGYVPRGHVTVVSGHGGVGKSLLALMLGVMVASGRPLFNVPTTRARVAFFSGEDPAELLLHRLLWVCGALGVDPEELDGWLHMIDATEGDPALFREVQAGGQRIGTPTATYADLSRYVERHAVELLMIDNMSDTFDAPEIERAKVRAFMRSLPTLRRERRLSVVLLAHVDKGTARGDRNGSEAYSGSTAVHNSARSRLYLSRDKEGALRLEHQKCNVGPLLPPLLLHWPEDGVPELEPQVGGHLAALARSNELRALLRLIHEFSERGEWISTAITSAASASRLLAGEPAYPKNRRPAEIQALLRDAERDGLIERIEYRNADRKARERWGLTGAGLVAIRGSAPDAPGPR